MIDHRTPRGREQLLRAMIAARAFDQAMSRHNKHWHEARGEEGTYIGACAGIGPADIASPHFRGACGVAMMHGAEVAELAAAVFGTDGSPSGGHWRGDICPVPSARRVGMYSGSLGTTVAYAVGGGLHLKQAGTGGVVISAFGDGTANTGIVAESMNMAGMLGLPVVFVCQDNQYATSLPSNVAIAGSLARRAEGFGLGVFEVDGNDVLAVAETVSTAAASARAGAGPQFVHALTYRMGGHYMNDPETYRTADEVAAWAERDPIARLRSVVVEEGSMSDEAVEALITAEDLRIGETVERAKDAAAPAPATFTSAQSFAESWRAAS